MPSSSSSRRFLSLWFPRLGAERLLRRTGGDPARPFAVIETAGPAQRLHSLSAGATAAGLVRGQPLRDALAMCPELTTRLRNPQAEAAFLAVLRRWAGKYSPWVGTSGEEGLSLDITGCAHLFGGEEGLLAAIDGDCAGARLSLRAGVADTPGAAWGLARFAGQDAGHHRSGDAVDQEARATRSRAAKRRHWERGGAAPGARMAGVEAQRIAPPGQTRSAIAGLPLAALRLDGESLAQLSRLGLRRVSDLIDQPRAPLARRFGPQVVLRIDQALGQVPEPVSPVAEARPFAVRMTLPDPIGLESDMLAGLDRLLPRLCETLERAGRGVRLIRLQAFRTDHTMQWVAAGLARPSADPDRIRPLLAMKIEEIEAGHGIDMLRLEAVQTEPLPARQAVGHLAAGRVIADRLADTTAHDDLVARIGARVGMEAITRWHPASSNIPEKTALTLAAAWSEPASDWPAPPAPRPLLLWRPEPVTAPGASPPPGRFRWRGRDLTLAEAAGPERIAPEWWLDEPDWRSGIRDYWRITTGTGDRLWLFFAHGAALSPGWFCHGQFA
ncbi:Putative DNA repair enzyme [Pseudooceanicola batsensis HTCC2597]|uniref:Putative DNA repair enzyme n=1 Tax=Pseudooceanicola batsensis (strain ATCC BAA-863 / DSM 15984 / KCTC 12145 / HTCC2597) TaxID=252305 RepID=A3TVS4_PSEBH|nr:DNA polymerase Y family protein [Pseudooceanicola batsensis]EAQ03720.1 Putative DNA repair enzyme [Pseudooceanicola batsensis HTCC2597]